jgi:cytochrome c-type biogenesis protein CcmE
MKRQRKKTLLTIIFVLLGISAAAGLVLYALKQSINLYYTPTQLYDAGMPKNRVIRIGGMVEKGSVHFASQGIMVTFILTDFTHKILVSYNGVLPTLFREGQGIVAEGKVDPTGVFIADQVLAKHDANYMPPEIKANVHS